MKAGEFFASSDPRYRCFSPHPLPPDIVYSPAVLHRCEAVAHRLGMVQMGKQMLPNAEVLTYASFRAEAIASSTIEDTVASPDELALFESGDVPHRNQVREVSNYRIALEEGVQAVRERTISPALIRELHATLMRDARGRDEAGQFKTQQNFIGRRMGDSIIDAIFVPPSPQETPALMRDLCDYIESTPDEPRLIQVALTHFQFETIHPFGDGNGRVGRLLILLQLIRTGLLDDPLVYPSAYFERTRDEYYSRLQAVRVDGDWDGWISYFLDALDHQAREAVTLASLLLKLQGRLRDQARSFTQANATLRALEAYFARPAMSITTLAETLGVSYNTASTAVATLESHGVLRPLGDAKRGRVYLCGPVYDLLFRGPEAVRESLG